MSPMVSVPDALALLPTTEMTSPALTGTVWLVSEQTSDDDAEGAPMVQVSAVAVGVVFIAVFSVGVVLSATLPLAPAMPMLLPQLVDREAPLTTFTVTSGLEQST